jgi:uncharacterized membrane protein
MSKRKKLFLVLTIFSALYFVVTHIVLNRLMQPHQDHYMSHDTFMLWISSTVVASLVSVYTYCMYADAY